MATAYLASGNRGLQEQDIRAATTKESIDKLISVLQKIEEENERLGIGSVEAIAWSIGEGPCVEVVVRLIKKENP